MRIHIFYPKMNDRDGSIVSVEASCMIVLYPVMILQGTLMFKNNFSKNQNKNQTDPKITISKIHAKPLALDTVSHHISR